MNANERQIKWFQALKTVTDINVLVKTLNLTPQTQSKFWEDLLALLKSEETPIHWAAGESKPADALMVFVTNYADLADMTVPGPEPEVISSVLYSEIKSLVDNEEEDSFWNESVQKLVEFFIHEVQNTDEKVIIPLEGEGHDITIGTLKKADAGNNFPEYRNQDETWVVPWWNIDNENYDEVRKHDKIIDILKNYKKMQYTRRPDNDDTEDIPSDWIRLLMPQYGRRVETEDLDRNFWVIGQVIAAISAYLFDEDSPIPKMLEGLLREVTEIWENIIYLWTEVAAISQDINDDVQVVVLPLQERVNEHGRQYDKFDTEVSKEFYEYSAKDDYVEIVRKNNFDDEVEKRLQYLTDQYNKKNLCVIPYIRLDNYKHNYYAGEWYPGIYTYSQKDKKWTAYKIQEAPSDIQVEAERYLWTSPVPKDIISKVQRVELNLTQEEIQQSQRKYVIKLRGAEIERTYRVVSSDNKYYLYINFTDEDNLQIGDSIEVETYNDETIYLSQNIEKTLGKNIGRSVTGQYGTWNYKNGTVIPSENTEDDDQISILNEELDVWLSDICTNLIRNNGTYTVPMYYASNGHGTGSRAIPRGYTASYVPLNTFEQDAEIIIYDIYAKRTDITDPSADWVDFTEVFHAVGDQYVTWYVNLGFGISNAQARSELSNVSLHTLFFNGIQYSSGDLTLEQRQILQADNVIWKMTIKKTKPEEKESKFFSSTVVGLSNCFIIPNKIYNQWKTVEEKYQAACYLGAFTDQKVLTNEQYSLTDEEVDGVDQHCFILNFETSSTIDFTLINLNPAQEFKTRELVISPLYDTSWEEFGETKKRFNDKMYASKQVNGRLLWSYPFSLLSQTATDTSRILMYGALRTEPIVSCTNTPNGISISRIALRVKDASAETVTGNERLLGTYELITGTVVDGAADTKYFQYESADAEDPAGLVVKKLSYKTLEPTKDGYYMGEVASWKGKTLSESKSENLFETVAHVIKVGSYLHANCASFETARMSDNTHTLMKGNATAIDGSGELNFFLNDWTSYLPAKDKLGDNSTALCFSNVPTKKSCAEVTEASLKKWGLVAVKNYLIKTNNLSSPCYVATAMGVTPWHGFRNVIYWDVGALCHLYHFIPSPYSLKEKPTDDSYDIAYDIDAVEIDGETGIMYIQEEGKQIEVGKIISCNLIKMYDSFCDGWGMTKNGAQAYYYDPTPGGPGKWRQFQIVSGADEKCYCVIINDGDIDRVVTYEVTFSKIFTGEVNYYDNRWAQMNAVDVFNDGAKVSYAPGITIDSTGYHQDNGNKGKGNIAKCTSENILITSRTNIADDVNNTGFVRPTGSIDFMSIPKNTKERDIYPGATEDNQYS